MVNNLLVILLIFAGIAGYKSKSLTLSGAVGTVIIGLATVVGFGYQGLLVMACFFVSSSYWSRYKRDRKQSSEVKNDKGSQRDIWQVLANGGVPAIISILYLFIYADFLLYMYIASVAAANSDTWASEIGPLSKRKPYYIRTLQQVEPGTSGAVSILGTIAAFFGAIFITMVSYFLWSEVSLNIAILIVIAGFLGNTVDTVLGSTVQATFRCSACQLVTERRIHCKQETTHNTGYLIFNNEMVNFLSIMSAAIVVLLFY